MVFASLPRLLCVVLFVQRRVWLGSKLTEPEVPPAPNSPKSFEFATLVLSPTLKFVPVVKLKAVDPKGTDWSTPP